MAQQTLLPQEQSDFVGETDAFTFSQGNALSDIAQSEIDARFATQQATINTGLGGITRGQDLKQCPTCLLPLHANISNDTTNVSGDVVVDKNSCPVRFVFGNGLKGQFTFKPGVNVGATFPVEGRDVLRAQCIVDPKNPNQVCKWSFTRTSP